MDKNSSKYILIYATVLVVVVAFILSFTSMALKERKRINVENETKEAILQSVGVVYGDDIEQDKAHYIQEQYDKYIVDGFVVKVSGEKIESDDPSYAFNVLAELKKEYYKPEEERELPIFVSKSDDGKLRYIIPLLGSGLWGPIWGYIALEEDLSTIYGAVFDHSGETPGLGAEINTLSFENQFKGKQIYKGAELVGVAVTKGVGSSEGNQNAVDGISGGTITSRGVQDMIVGNLKEYSAFIESEKQKMIKEREETSIEAEVDFDEDNSLRTENDE